MTIIMLCSGCSSSQLTVSESVAEQFSSAAELRREVSRLIIEASIYELLEEYGSALESYKSAQSHSPNSQEIYFAIAQCYQKMGRLENAVSTLEQGLKIDSSHVDITYNLALLHDISSNKDDALILYKLLLEKQPYDSDIHMRLAALYLSSQRNELAIEHFEQILKLGEATPQIWHPLGLLYLSQENYDDALSNFREWLKEYPGSENAIMAIGQVYKAQQDTTGLIEWYQQNLAENSSMHLVRADLQDVYIGSNNIDGAIELYEKAVQNDSTDAPSVSNLGMLYFQKGDTLSAKKIYESALRTHPEEWIAHFNMGRLHYFSSKWHEAIPFLKKAAEYNTQLPDVWLMLSDVYSRVDSLALAEEAAKSAVTLQPTNPQANFALGIARYQQGDLEGAVKPLENSIQVNRGDTRVLSLLASILSELKDYERSDALYERALDLNLMDPLIRNNYSYSLAERGIKLDYALELINIALQTEPENGAFLDTKAWIFFQKKSYEDALHWVNQALKYRKTSAEVWEHQGDINEKLGNWDDARTAWKKAIELDENRKTAKEKIKNLGNRE